MEKTKLLSKNVEKEIIRLIQISIENGNSVPDSLLILSKMLLTEGSNIPDDISLLLSNSIDDYRYLIQNYEYLSSLSETFNLIYDYMFKMEDVTFKIEGRVKGAVNSLEKMIRLLNQGKALDLFRDAVGIRIIIFGNECDNLQQKAYQITNDMISFMSKKHFILCEADTISHNISLDSDVEKNILIPKKSSVLPLYRTGVKDYFLYPKFNGYQSLHTVFRARNNSFIEIQVRTEQMHLNAEYNDAKHSLYKIDKYGDRLHSKLDFTKVHMPGFRYMKDGTIYDDIGLQTSMLTFYRTKSF